MKRCLFEPTDYGNLTMRGSPGRRAFSVFRKLEPMLKCGPKRSSFTKNSTRRFTNNRSRTCKLVIALCLMGHTIGRYVELIKMDV
jgi:hypothetical protein